MGGDSSSAKKKAGWFMLGAGWLKVTEWCEQSGGATWGEDPGVFMDVDFREAGQEKISRAGSRDNQHRGSGPGGTGAQKKIKKTGLLLEKGEVSFGCG